MFNDAEMGALPTLYAAAGPEVRGGEYFGPDGFQEFRGGPVKVSMTNATPMMKKPATIA